ncbi:MAG: hypothetical protein AB8G11_20555 [Saprospiraceae bacterium]
MKKITLFILFLSVTIAVKAQVYTEKQTRHRFAQMTLGLDFQSSFGGQTIVDPFSPSPTLLDFKSTQSSHFIIGGTHFWGHADFYVAIPLFSIQHEYENNYDIFHSSGVETVFKYYPWRIEDGKIRPFIGVSLAPFSFQQGQNSEPFQTGALQSNIGLPILSGVTFNRKNHLIELNLLYNYNNEIDYYLSENYQTTIQTPPIYASLAYKFMFETTLSAEQSWENGKTEEVTNRLAKNGKLNGFFVGAGMSSTWLIGQSDYNENYRPYIPTYDNAVMPDFTIGYYLHNPDVNIAVNYRGYSQGAMAYGTQQSTRRRSVGLEVTKGLFDYHGFVPFVGPIVSYENLSFSELTPIMSAPRAFSDNRIGYGLTLGWDIRPNRIQWFVLRTNLRYFPNLKLPTSDSVVNFNNIEFNFIQMVVYPNRI